MYDVIVIGGGSGGYAAAIRASQLGGSVALVEGREIGGTCVNRGCIPSKVWLRAAYLLYCLRNGEAFGIRGDFQSPDLQAVVDRKNGVAGDIRMGMEGLLANNQVDVLAGQGTIRNPGEVMVDGKPYQAKNIIIATGSSLAIPDIPGLEDAAMTTDEVLDMTSPPESVLIWGNAGPIELEMATILSIYGAKVYLASDHPRLLPREDHDTSQRIAQALRELGIEVLPRSPLKAVSQSGGLFKAELGGAKEKTVDVARVLVSGRKPNLTGLGLDQVGVELNEDGGVRINDRLESSVKGIYAIGDATGGWMLSHAASSMAIPAAENAMGRPARYPFSLIPRVLWTIPQVGSIGLSEEEAEKQGYDVEVGDFPYAINGLAMLQNEMSGSVKYVVDSKYGEILGVHVVGANATELIGEAGLAMQLECTASELARGFRAHPTFSEAIVDAARDVGGWALYLPRK